MAAPRTAALKSDSRHQHLRIFRGACVHVFLSRDGSGLFQWLINSCWKFFLFTPCAPSQSVSSRSQRFVWQPTRRGRSLRATAFCFPRAYNAPSVTEVTAWLCTTLLRHIHAAGSLQVFCSELTLSKPGVLLRLESIAHHHGELLRHALFDERPN